MLARSNEYSNELSLSLRFTCGRIALSSFDPSISSLLSSSIKRTKVLLVRAVVHDKARIVREIRYRLCWNYLRRTQRIMKRKDIY